MDMFFFWRRFHYRSRCVSSPICIRTEAYNPTWKMLPLTFPSRILHFSFPPSMWQQVILQTCFITLRIPMCHTLTCVYDFPSFLSFFYSAHQQDLHFSNSTLGAAPHVGRHCYSHKISSHAFIQWLPWWWDTAISSSFKIAFTSYTLAVTNT